jgi:diguanylate cyclase (GGDEF)-like protein
MDVVERIFQSVPSFRSKQRLVIMLACSIVLAATMACFLVYSYFTFNHESRERLSALGNIIGENVGVALALEDEQAVIKSLAALQADPTIKQIFVLNSQDQVIAYYHHNKVVAPADLQLRLQYVRAENKNDFLDLCPEVEMPVLWSGIQIGSILIEQNENVITSKIIASIGIGSLILLLALGFSYILAERFQKIITGPVTAMANAMKEVSHTRNYSKRVAASGSDEMDQLADHFNEMLSEIERQEGNLLERQEQLYQLANFDTLTSLPNRAHFSDRLYQALRRAARTGELLAVLFIDLDNFKMINDTHGHLTGDHLLKETAARLAAGTRADDTLARLGGDEFTIFLQDVKTEENAMAVARKHVESLFQPYLNEGKQLFISASIGVALFPEQGTSAETLMKNADSAMYLAKEKGRNRVELFNDSLHLDISKRLDLSNDLHRALEHGEFELYYQPRINLERNSWASAEALIRWNHPELGIIAPDMFIPLAEQTGLILPIGEWVLREACRQLHQWHCQGFNLPRISVNVSPIQLQRQDLVSITRDALASNNLCTQALELEIVESALVEDSGRAITVLEELRNIGVKISIDDFGTGYSSLSYLRSLPIDILKIDRSFLLRAHESKKDDLILTAIIAMSLSLGLEVVTEGVEFAEQEQILKNNNCQEAQGFYFAHPMPAGEMLNRFVSAQIGLENVRIHSSDSSRPLCCMLATAPTTRCGLGPKQFLVS